MKCSICRLFLGGVIGAIVASVWGFFSWGVLPWHDISINKFKNQERVMQVMKENVSVDGVYIAPEIFSGCAGARQEGCLGKKSPFIYAQIKQDGIDFSQPSHYLYDFLIHFVGACLIGALLMRIVGRTYGERLLFVTIVGLVAGFSGLALNWNWFGAGYCFTLVMCVDTLIQWFLMGLFLAKFVQPKGKCECKGC